MGVDPRRFGPYMLLRVIDSGGFSVVYEAEQDQPHRHVALKVLPPELAFRAEIRSRFLREAGIEAELLEPGGDPAEVLAKIQRCATELEDMVRDVLDFSRLDRGNITVERIAFNPVRALEEVVAELRSLRCVEFDRAQAVDPLAGQVLL